MSGINMSNPIDAAKQKVNNVKMFEGNKNGKIDTREEVGILSVFLESADLTQKQIDYLSDVISEANESILKEEEKIKKQQEKEAEKARKQKEKAETEERERQLGGIPDRVKELSNKNGYLAKDGAAELVRLLRSDALTEIQSNYVKEVLKNSGFDAENFDLTDVPEAKPNNTQFSLGVAAGVGTYGATGNISAGMRVNNTYVDLSVGSGKADVISGKVGHEWSLGKKIGLNLYAGAQARRSNNVSQDNITINSTSTAEKNDNFSIDNGNNSVTRVYNNTRLDVNSKSQTDLSYNSSDMRIGLGTMLTYQMNKRVKVGLGFEAGVLRQTNANVFTAQNNQYTLNICDYYNVVDNDEGRLSLIYPLDVSSTSKESINTANGNTLKGYVTPAASLEIGLDKDNKLLLKAEGNIFEGRVGVQYNF